MRALTVTYDEDCGELRRATWTSRFLSESALVRADVLKDIKGVIEREYEAAVKEAFKDPTEVGVQPVRA